MGDLNCLPTSKEYKLIESLGFTSSYKACKSTEPEITFPTGLTGPHMDLDPPGTFDYIWVKGNHVTPIKSYTFGEA